MTRFSPPDSLRRIRGAAPLLLVLAAACVHAQQVYRVVGPDGKVTFSDRPPPAASAAAATGGASKAGDTVGLPYELRQVAGKYPVTLYTAPDCAPCSSARNLLLQRGVPFAERTVTTSEDSDALQKLSGTGTLPFGTIGSQHLQGFSDAEWSQYLDAAGYPKQSQLPSNFRPAAATPLVAAKRLPAASAPAAAGTAPQASTDQRPAPAAPQRTPANPAGITF